MKYLKELKREIMEANGELVAELEVQKINLGPADVNLPVIDFDDAQEATDNYHNAVIEKIEAFENRMESFYNDGKMLAWLAINWNPKDTVSEVLRKFIEKEIVG